MDNDLLHVGGRIALVTGAGQGVGRQIALHLARHGSRGIAVNDFYADRAQSVVEEIREAGGKAVAVAGDVTDLEQVKQMVAKTNEAFGDVGILINNAGNLGPNPSADHQKPFWETGPEVWNQTIGVNFYGVINCVSAVVPGMIARNAPGRIVTIISDASRHGDVGLEVYGGAKAGAAGFMRGVARALGRHEITANCVSIAMTNTPATEKQLQANPELLKRALSNYIVRRPGQPIDVANMVLFLASDASSWISGQTYPVNGGFTLAI